MDSEYQSFILHQEKLNLVIFITIYFTLLFSMNQSVINIMNLLEEELEKAKNPNSNDNYYQMMGDAIKAYEMEHNEKFEISFGKFIYCKIFKKNYMLYFIFVGLFTIIYITFGVILYFAVIIGYTLLTTTAILMILIYPSNIDSFTKYIIKKM